MTSSLDSTVKFARVSGDEAADLVDELSALHREVYAESPYQWGEEHVTLFQERFAVERRQAGFDLIVARSAEQLVGFAFGLPLQPSTRWWHNLITEVDPALTEERPGRTLAVIGLSVRQPWRRQGIAKRFHDLLLEGRTEERATLTVLPDATSAQHAYAKWGWQWVAQKRNPLPGSPVFDVMVKELR